MVLFLLFFAQYLGVSRRQHSFGIALGFGFFAMVELSLVASWVGEHVSPRSMELINMGAYNCTLLIWLGYVLAKVPVREAPATLLRPQRWEQSLTDPDRSGDALRSHRRQRVGRARRATGTEELTRTAGAPPDEALWNARCVIQY